MVDEGKACSHASSTVGEMRGRPAFPGGNGSPRQAGKESARLSFALLSQSNLVLFTMSTAVQNYRR